MTEDENKLPPRSNTHGTKENNKITFFSKKGKKEVVTTDVPSPLPTEGFTNGNREISIEPASPAQDNVPVLSRSNKAVRTEQPTTTPVLSRSARGGSQGGAPAAQRATGMSAPGTGSVNFQKPSPLVILVILLAVFMAILDTSIVNVSLPKMMAVFGVGTTDIQWVLTAYTLVVGALVPVTGYLGDRFGYRRIFLVALVIFTVGSGLCGAAWSNQAMIFFRILQAIGGGALMPVSMAMIFRMFPPERRGAAMGMFGIAVMFAPAIGPTLSGYITEYLNWRLIFYINVPVGILDFFLALAVLKEVGQPIERRFDFWGFLTSTVGFSTLLYGLGIVADKGWGDVEVVSYLTVAIVSLIAFVTIELSVKEPMMELRLLKNVQFTLTLIITSITSIVLFGTLFLLPVFLQNISGLSALQTGLLLLPQALTTGVMMPIAGRLYDKFGARWLAVIGLALTAYSCYLMQDLDVNTAKSTIVMWLMVRAVGIGMTMMPVQTAGMNALHIRHVGQATAITNTARQVAASFGIAWLTVLLTNRTINHVAWNREAMSMFNPITTGMFNHVQSMFASLGTNGAHLATVMMLLGKVRVMSTVQAMDDVFYVLSWVTLVCILLSFFLHVKRKGKDKSAAPMIHE